MLVFNMTWLMETLKIYLEEQLLTKYCMIKTFNIAKNPRYNGYQRGLASMVYTFFHKNIAGGAIKNEIMQSKELAEELRKQLLEILKNGKHTYLL